MDELCIFMLCGSVAKVCAVVQYAGGFCSAGFVAVGCVRSMLLWAKWYHPHVGVVTFRGVHDSDVVV